MRADVKLPSTDDDTKKAEEASKGFEALISVAKKTLTGKVQDESLQVTVSRQVPTFFMQVFGINNITVSRTALRNYQDGFDSMEEGKCKVDS